MKAPIMALIVAMAATTAMLMSHKMQTPKSEVSQDMIKRYQQWRVKFQKLYGTPAESDYRLRVFVEVANQIDQDNNDYERKLQEKGLPPLTEPMFSHQEFSDLTKEEFRVRYTGLRDDTQDMEESVRLEPSPKVTNLKHNPELSKSSNLRGNFEIRVRYQNICGSCWCFSATAIFEKYAFEEKGIQYDLSQQELLDCTPILNGGCNGGFPDFALRYVAENGQALISAYPYEGKQNPTCRADTIPEDQKVKVDGLNPIRYQYSTATAILASQKGYFTGVGVFATGRFRHLSSCQTPYEASFSGECSNNRNHAATLFRVSKAYNSLLNSWGKSWGHEGWKRIIPCADNNFWGLDGYLVSPELLR